MKNNNEVLDALNHIPCDCVSGLDWLRIGMALHREGFSVDVWDAWAATDESISRSHMVGDSAHPILRYYSNDYSPFLLIFAVICTI